ncbi:MAG: ROK family glucokinase [Lachnospiraceae bacterium]|nr:ROK family glucokinase [Lachnospiraceae bacterium]MEE1342644.1 ROK family glucokinase [Lachnospiraceae bacterium]
MAEFGFGVDLGGTTVKLGLFGVEGNILDKWEIPTRKENQGAYILGDIAEALNKKLEERNIPKYNVAGVGMGVPGPIKDDGTVMKCVNLGWDIFNVAEELSKLMDLPVKVGNDANMAALGESWQGGGKGFKNVVMVTLGTGVGGGIIVDGKMIAGTNGAGGEIGHITMNTEETASCGCGKKGCLEQYASATGIVNSAKKLLASSDKPSALRELDEVTCKDIFDCAKANDELAKELVESLGKNLGLALAHISCVVDPEVFVIGGGVSKAGDILLEVIQKYYVQYAFHASRNTKFALAKLGNDAGMYGGAKLILGK